MNEPRELELRRYLECQRELAAQLLEGESLEGVAPSFLGIVGDLLDWESAALWEVPDEADELRFVCGWSAADFDAEPLWELSRTLTYTRGDGLVGRVWETGEPAFALREGEARSYPRAEMAAELGLQAGLALPVCTGPGGEVLAILEIHSKSTENVSEQPTELLTSFAAQLAAFIERRRADAAARYEMADALRARQHLAEVVRGTQDAVLSKDLEGYVTSWNQGAERLYGYSEEEAVGQHISFLIPPDHANEEMVILDRVKRGERLETYETERIRADGVRIAVSLTISPIAVPQSGLIGASVIARDITSARRQRQAREFLLSASRLLDSSLDPDQTARTIVGTAVPELAEICVLDFLRPDGKLGDSVVAGTDPEAASRLERIRREAPIDPAGNHPAAQVLREGKPMIWRDLRAPGIVEDVAQNDEHRELMEDAGYNSAAVVPLVARGRVLGALSFLHVSNDLRFDSGDLDFLGELGDRAALVLDNSRLYRERDEIAVNLQRGLRPPHPAEIEGLEIAVVFEAAGRGIEVGGDVYDVLPTEDGCWVLIGDVAGKGSVAAGVSVALRHSVRGLTRELGEPAEVLRHVNELLLAGETLNDFATAVLVRFWRHDDGWRLSLASAGHPPAVVIGKAGTRLLGGGTVLGAWNDAVLARHDAALGPGDTLLLCTDGLLEAGPVAAHTDPEELAASAHALGSLEPAELTKRLRDQALARGSGELRDDLVVIALRPSGLGVEEAPAGDERRPAAGLSPRH